MNLSKIAMSICGIFLVYTALFASCSNAFESAPGTQLLGVRSFMENVDNYSGSVAVKGVVSQIIAARNIVTLSAAAVLQC